MRNCTFLFLLLTLPSCNAEPTGEISEPLLLGEPLSLDQTVPIRDILAEPQAFVGRKVAVAGRVVGVCARMGCYIEIEDVGPARIRVKVQDGTIVFPQSAMGREAVAEGTVERLSYTREEYLSHRQHEAEMKGELFDESSIGGPPYEVIQIWGSGARISTGP